MFEFLTLCSSSFCVFSLEISPSLQYISADFSIFCSRTLAWRLRRRPQLYSSFFHSAGLWKAKASCSRKLCPLWYLPRQLCKQCQHRTLRQPATTALIYVHGNTTTLRILEHTMLRFYETRPQTTRHPATNSTTPHVSYRQASVS